MKTMKRMFSIMLSLVMVLSGIYCIKIDGTEAKAEEATKTATSDTPDKGMLDVKIQTATTENGDAAMRFVTSVNGLNYQTVGFEITPEGGTSKQYNLDTVYERIESKDNGMEYEFSPKVVDASSKYFATAKMKVEENKTYTVQAYVVPLGSTNPEEDIVYGQARCIKFADGTATDYVNVSFESTKDVSGSISNVTYGENGSTTATVIGRTKNSENSYTIHTHIANVNPNNLPSATKFVFGEYGSAIYRNYYTSYANGLDKSWYTVDTNADEFFIASNADLYGLWQLVDNEAVMFTDKTVIQVRDIVVNEGTASKDNWTPKTGDSFYEWNHIGSFVSGDNRYAFAGTFDGDFNEISGIVQKGDRYGTEGLFGYTLPGSIIKNVKLVNSYFSFNESYSGAIVGDNNSSFENIYVGKDVFINSTTGIVGGMVGCQNYNASGNTYKNCWFDGVVTSTSGNAEDNVGGFVGYSSGAIITMENCLFTGTVNGTNLLGGFVAGAHIAGSQTGTITIKNALAAGTINATTTSHVGQVLGTTMTTCNINIENVYTLDSRTSLAYTVTGIGHCYPYSTSTIANVSGVPIKITDELNGMGAYTGTEFDFWSQDNENGVWAVVEGATPVIKKLYDGKVVEELSGVRASEGWYYAEYKMQGEVNAAIPSAAEFELDSVADLNGFAEKVSGGEAFNSDTIKLRADLNLNPGWTPSVDENGVLTNAPENQWTPIGNMTNQFAGTFTGLDGDEIHSIHGVFVNSDSKQVGLFGVVAAVGTVENLKIENSYIASTNVQVGTVAGLLYGDVKGVYVGIDVYVKSIDSAGGIAGQVDGTDTKEISNCWVEGNIYGTAGYSGGIAGLIISGDKTISNCLFSGTLTIPSDTSGSAQNIGGLVGWTSASNITLQNCLVTGQFKDATYLSDGVGSAVGWVQSGAYNEINVYVTCDWNGTGSYDQDKDGMLLEPEQVTGTAAFDNMGSFPLRQAETGTEAWVATEAGPQLAIFATLEPCYP